MAPEDTPEDHLWEERFRKQMEIRLLELREPDFICKHTEARRLEAEVIRTRREGRKRLTVLTQPAYMVAHAIP